MRVEAICQCDALIGGQRKALFPGQRYELPEEALKGLVMDQHIRVIVGIPEARVTSRPRARK